MGEGNTHKTAQEKLWAGEFGKDYVARKKGEKLLSSNLAFFSRFLRQMRGASSCVEFGANIGMNLKALRLLYPHMDVHGIEINGKAAKELSQSIGSENVSRGSILEVDPPKCDLALIKGVLIHMIPDVLGSVYEKMVNCTRRYLLVAEYYNPSLVTVKYRGQDDSLFKRDFAGEIMNRYPVMALVDYGFVYCRDPAFPGTT